MGAGASRIGFVTATEKKHRAEIQHHAEHPQESQDFESFSMNVDLERNMAIVSHYMPPVLPIEATMDGTMMPLVNKTWQLIVAGTADGMRRHQNKSGIVLFYDEFFFRLFKRARVFLEVFPEPAKRGEVLMKALGMLIRIEGKNSKQENQMLFYLGRGHRYKSALRPWMFSVYMTTCLETLMFWLGTDADLEVGNAWTCLTSYVLKRMLIAYLPGKVVPNEYYQNTNIDAVRLIVQQSVHSRLSVQGSEMPDEIDHNELTESHKSSLLGTSQQSVAIAS